MIIINALLVIFVVGTGLLLTKRAINLTNEQLSEETPEDVTESELGIMSERKRHRRHRNYEDVRIADSGDLRCTASTASGAVKFELTLRDAHIYLSRKVTDDLIDTIYKNFSAFYKVTKPTKIVIHIHDVNNNGNSEIEAFKNFIREMSNRAYNKPILIFDKKNEFYNLINLKVFNSVSEVFVLNDKSITAEIKAKLSLTPFRNNNYTDYE
jgi:hypothetical protein